MKIFHCDHCGQVVFFESVRCVACGGTLAFLPDVGVIGTLTAAEGDRLWTSPAHPGEAYRLCQNYERENVCNWAVPAADGQPYCQSCRLTRTIPNLETPGHRAAWFRLEAAKRRLVYNLLELHLPVLDQQADPEAGLAFDFLADPPSGAAVLTGHANGIVAVNIAEADDPVRESRRVSLHEPYRTLLGHLRHEVGHYYWNRLIKDRPCQDGFRKIFGDETADYPAALARHYEQGAPPDWAQHFVSAYASCHPWEDWAETWAHYLHLRDTLETASACGLALKPPRQAEPVLEAVAVMPEAFGKLIHRWFAVVYVLNNLNRCLGVADAYPFVLSPPVLEKLRFVHEIIAEPRAAAAAPAVAPLVAVS